MSFKSYIDAYRNMADWCLDEAFETEHLGERALWLDAAEFWRERAVRAAMAQARIDKEDSETPPDADLAPSRCDGSS